MRSAAANKEPLSSSETSDRLPMATLTLSRSMLSVNLSTNNPVANPTRPSSRKINVKTALFS